MKDQKASNILKEFVLCQALTDSTSRVKLSDINRVFDCRFVEDTLNVVLFSFDQKKGKQMMPSYVQSLEGWIREKIEGAIDSSCYEHQFTRINGCLALLLDYPAKNLSRIVRKLNAAVRRINEEDFFFIITAGVGKGRTPHLSELYEEAKIALISRISLGSGGVIRAGELQQRTGDVFCIPEDPWINRMVNAIAFMDLIAVWNCISDGIEAIETERVFNPYAIEFFFDEALLVLRESCLRFHDQSGKYFRIRQLIDDGGEEMLLASDSFSKLKTSLFSLYREAFSTLGVTGGSGEKSYVSSVRRYVEEHYYEKINVDALARSMYLNADYFSSLYKKETGESFSEYLRNYRITMACSLLKNRKYTVGEVGSLVGYPDPKYFCRVFKRTTGLTPLRYRNSKT